MEYFCVAKPQKRDLKAVQGAKRLMLERLVRHYFDASNSQIPKTGINFIEPIATIYRLTAVLILTSLENGSIRFPWIGNQ